MKLHVSIEPGDGEMPADFASRLATRVCRDDLWAFCADFGLDTQGIIDGNIAAVSNLADLAEVSAERLMREAFIRLDASRRFLHKGEEIARRNLTRDKVKICPACVAEDVDRLDFRLQARPYRRSEWILRSLHTCAKHEMALVDLGAASEIGQPHETSLALASALPELDHLVKRAKRRPPSAFEEYIRKRLAGEFTSPWLDTHPLFAVCDMTRVVGAVAVHGPKVTIEALDGDQIRKSEAAGFDVLRRGKDGIDEMLDGLQEKFWRARTAWGPKAMFGRLYEWLAHESYDLAFEPMRQIMMKHVHRTLPVGPSETMFGRAFGRRRLHSVHSASLEFDHHPKRLRKLLLDGELVGPETKGLSDERVLFDAKAGSAFIANISGALKFGEAARYLNIPRPHDRAILVKSDFFEPLVRSGSSEKLKGDLFRRRDLDAFLVSLTRDAAEVGLEETNRVSIPTAAKRSCCDVVTVVRLIRARKLRRIAIRPCETGFLSVVVDVAEIRPLVVGPDHGGLNLRTVEKELKTTNAVVKYLVREGFLRAERVSNPVHKGIQTIVRPAELERFRVGFATLHSLAVSQGVHARTMRRRLSAAGVQPVAEEPKAKLTLYRRADIP